MEEQAVSNSSSSSSSSSSIALAHIAQNASPTKKKAFNASDLLVSAAHKSGMPSNDSHAADIANATQRAVGTNSDFIKNQIERDEKADRSIAKKRQELIKRDNGKTHSDAALAQMHAERRGWRYHKEVDELDPFLADLIAKRSAEATVSTCVVVDFDSFFFSCHAALDDSLNAIPCAVGTGIITTSNYKAREYGVRSGQNLGVAKKLVAGLSLFPSKLFVCILIISRSLSFFFFFLFLPSVCRVIEEMGTK
jgi:hypothetical protein